MTSAERTAEGDYERFMSSTAGHLVVIIMITLTVLYIRLMGISMFSNLWKFIKWLCCCGDDDDDEDDDDEDDDATDSRLDSSATSQTPMNQSVDSNMQTTPYMQSEPYQDTSYEYATDMGCDEYYDEEAGDEIHHDHEGNENYPPNEEYYEGQYIDEGHDQHYSDNQYYGDEENSSADYDEHSHPQQSPLTSRHPQPQGNTSVIPRRRNPTSQRPPINNTDAYNPMNSTRKPRVHPSRMN